MPSQTPAEGGRFAMVDGIPHYLSVAAAGHLLALAADFDPVWCSGWEEKADEHLPHLLGLPSGWPHLYFDRNPGRTHAHWKLDAIDAYAGERALAWIDDALDDECRTWAARRAERGAPTLLVQTDPRTGLGSAHAAQLREWARRLSPAGA